jgi:uncharacterized protein (DUF697 family)
LKPKLTETLMPEDALVTDVQILRETPETSDARSRREIAVTARQCRRLVNRRALLAAGVAVIPVPGLDIATDVGLLMWLIPRINQMFGLSEEQIEQLSPQRRVIVYKAITAVGGAMIGRLITRELIIHALQSVGLRSVARQAGKFVPIAGQVLAATLSFTALRYVCNQHIEECLHVSLQLGAQSES